MESQDESINLTALKQFAVSFANEASRSSASETSSHCAMISPDRARDPSSNNLGSLTTNKVDSAAGTTTVTVKAPLHPPHLPNAQHEGDGMADDQGSPTQPWNTASEVKGEPIMAHPSSGPGDTQPISQSAYDSILKQSDTAGVDTGADSGHIVFGVDYSEVGITQKTLNEGDTGHVDLLAGFDDTEVIPENNSDEDKNNEDHDPDEIGDSPPIRYEPFPESQRFLNHTPAPVRSGATEENPHVTPVNSGNPFREENEAPSTGMGLTQLFKATQAPSSPTARTTRPDFSSDMPSPNLPIQRQNPTGPLTSPLQMTSSIKRPRLGEPQTSYVSLKESQAAREKLLRSTSKDRPVNAASDEAFFDEDCSLQRRVRRKLDDEKVGRQFATITAPARPGAAGRTIKAISLSPTFGRQRPSSDDTVPSKSFPTESERRGAPKGSGHEGDSEVETEQEDEGVVRCSQSSQHPQPSGEEDKENLESGPVQVLGTAVRAHDALSQALDMEASPSARNRPASTIPVSTSDGHVLENLHGTVPAAAGEAENEPRIMDSQAEPVDAQGQDNQAAGGSQIQKAALEEWDQEHPSKTSPSSTPKSIVPSSPPPQPSHVGTQNEHTHDDSPSHGGNSDDIRPGLQGSSMQDVPGTVQGARNAQGYGRRTPGETWATPSKSRNNRSSPFSGAFVTPRQHPQSEGFFQQTIPETSPTARRSILKNLDSTSLGNQDSPTSPKDDGLPPIPRHSSSDRAHLRASDMPKQNKSDPVSAIFSSPSGRQRRTMTEIATDMSPRPAVPDVQLDELGFMTAEDKEFQAIVAEPHHSPVRKRRRVNGGRVVPVSAQRYRQLPSNLSVAATAHSDPGSHQDNVNEADGDKHEGVEEQRQRKEQRRDIPQNAIETQSQYSRQSQARSDVSSRHQVAYAVVIRTPDSSSPIQAKGGKKNSVEPRRSVENAVTEGLPSFRSSQVPNQPLMTVNRVIAFFNGKPQGYFPAMCVGLSKKKDKTRCLVEFEDTVHPDVIEERHLKRLELRVDDQVKVDYPGLPKKPFVVVGFTDKLDSTAVTPVNGNGESAPVTDIHGHRSLIVKPRQTEHSAPGQEEPTVTVPMSSIYFDKALWTRLGDRPFSYSPPAENEMTVKSRTQLNESHSPRLRASGTPTSVTGGSGLFSNMAFALSSKDERKMLQIDSLITRNGGRILEKGFDELFESPSIDSATFLGNDNDAASTAPTSELAMKLNKKAENTGFVSLITDECSRTYKYLQALALNLPCLSARWVRDCVSKKQLVDWEDYLLAAGQSKVLDDATKSRVLAPYSAATASLSNTVAARSKMLSNQTVLLVMGRGKTAREREPYASLIRTMAPSRIHHVQDLESATDILMECKTHSSEQGWDWIYVGDETAAATARQSLKSLSKSITPRGRGRPPKRPLTTTENVVADDVMINGRKVKILDNEVLCQSLIFGRLLGWSDIGSN